MKKEYKSDSCIMKNRGKYRLLTIDPTKPNHLITIILDNMNSKVPQVVIVSIKKFYPRYKLM